MSHDTPDRSLLDPFAETEDQQALRALGVPKLDSVDNEQAIAGAERALFRDGIL